MGWHVVVMFAGLDAKLFGALERVLEKPKTSFVHVDMTVALTKAKLFDFFVEETWPPTNAARGL